MQIDNFYGKYRFLSNFYPCEIEYEGLIFHSVEAAYQASKCNDIDERRQFCDLSPVEAKKRGRKVPLPLLFNKQKDVIMLVLVRQKFERSSELRDLLISTGDALLIEGNTWGDTYWGVCNGVGQNKLGYILMQVRDELNWGY
jgi:hypothetical protein